MSKSRRSRAAVDEYFLKSIGEWMQLAQEGLREMSIKAYIPFGNDDAYDVEPSIARSIVVG